MKIPRDLGEDTTSGLRLGTAELTRMGMREKEMRPIATFLKRAIVTREDPKSIATDVEDFVNEFKRIVFGFDRDGFPFTLPVIQER